MVFNEKYTKILELATAQDEEFKSVLNQIIKMLNEQEKATLAASEGFKKTHLIEGDGEPFSREIDFEHYGRTYPDDDGVYFEESNLQIEDVNVEVVEKDGKKSYTPKVIEIGNAGNLIASLKKSYSLNLVDFTREWVDSLETFNSLDDYNAKCNGDDGIVATDIMVLDVLDYAENGAEINSKTYSLDVVKILDNYYLNYSRTSDLTNDNGEYEITEEKNKFIPITKEELYALADLNCELKDSL